MKNLLLTLSFFFIVNATFSQNFCPGNLFTNGDLEIGTPTGGDQDINNATGFSSIWPSGSLADFYAWNAGPFPTPLPPSGNYAGLWIANYASASTTYREGLFNSLNTPIAFSSGLYSFTFDVACMGGWGTSEIGIYGIYNPSGGYSATPTSSHAPSNEDLFGATNTVLLGTVFLADSCDRYKTTQTISFNSGLASFPTGGITHVLLTHSDDTISGAIYVGLDNFCMQLDSPAEDTCAVVINEKIECDANGYTYTFFVQNNTGEVVDGIIVDGDFDPGVVIPPGGTHGPITINIPAGTLNTYCFDITLFSENLTCCHTSHCIDLPICDPCDDTDLRSNAIDNGEDDCCYEVDVINNFDDTYFTKIVSTIITPGVNFDTPSGDNGWSVTTLASNILEWTPPGTYIDDIADLGVLNFCLKDINQVSQTPQVIVFDWIVVDPTGEQVVCSDTLTFYCEPCMNIENDKIDCLSDGSYEYCFTITNNSSEAATQLYFDPYTPSGIVFSPNPLDITLPANSTQSYCVNISGGSPGDVVAYKAILKNFDGDLLNWCCAVDTFRVRLPECGQMPCPIIEDFVAECGEDLDGDGQVEYTLDLYITGNGTINVSSGCGTVSPATMAITGAGYYTFTVYNTGNCNPFPLTFYSYDTNGENCANGQWNIPLPQCPPVNDCHCDESFYDNVSLGFSDIFDCPNGEYRPYALTECDDVFWSVNGVNVGETTGNESFSYVYPGVGEYEVCMLVIRTQADGTECERQVCRLITINQWCLQNEVEVLKEKIEAIPNPVSSLLRIRWNSDSTPASVSVKLFNAHGKVVKSIGNLDSKAGSVEMDVSDLDAGFYYARVDGKSYTSEVVKIVKVKE